MPHRPADSRLLSNLLSHEKDYVRSLHSQLDYGQSSLSSFSAYAAASPPSASRAIGSVATALVGAHDALRGYVLAVEEWCEQLKMLKEMEDEVGTIARDREILVDRLIKASKSNNPKRRSIIPSSTSNQQNTSGFSASNSTLEHLSFSNSKLNLAQNELQACETHLTEKERILAQMRESAFVGGLRSRCKALVECGWKWAEVGKDGLKALDSSVPKGSPERPGLHTQKPLPDPNYPYQRPSSDLSSSLAPSQSASQIFHADVNPEQYHPSSGSSSGPGTRGHAPEADMHDRSRFALNLPPAHAISEEDHYTPPQMRAPDPATAEDELGGSSVEETDERQFEVHENLLFSHPSTSNVNSKQLGSKTRLSLRRPKRQNSDSAAVMSTSASAPLPTNHSSKAGTTQRNNDPFGMGSSANTKSDGQQDSPRRRKHSAFLGLGALTGIFHRRDRTTSAYGAPSSASPSNQTPPSPKKGGHWLTRTDKNLKKAGKGEDSSDDDVERAPVQTNPIPSFLAQAAASRTLSESRSAPTEMEAQASGSAGPKRPRPGGKKLRKTSDGDAQRKISGSGQSNEGRKSDINNPAKENTGFPRSQSIGNGHTLSPLSAPVSRSSTVRSQSTVKTSSSTRPASLDLPSSRAKGRRTGTSSDSGHATPGNAHRRRTSLGHVSAPPTHGQTSLLSIVEDVSRQNRQGWLQSNPNSLLVEIKAPKSVYQSTELGGPVSASPTQHANSDTSFTRAGGRKESPLRPQLVNGYRKGSISASNSEPSLPLKRLPATPIPAPKAPLRSAMRNRSVSPSPAVMSPPRAVSPVLRKTGTQTPAGTDNLTPPVLERKGTGSSSVNDNDSASLSSAYETGHEDLEDDPPTPQGQAGHMLPNGFVSEAKPNGSQLSASASSTGGTATPPSRRKSVRVSLKPTFSPTPPALADDEEDHAPWAPASAPTEDEPANSGWTSRTLDAGWEDSSDEDEEYTRAKQMLQKASRKLEKVSRGG